MANVSLRTILRVLGFMIGGTCMLSAFFGAQHEALVTKQPSRQDSGMALHHLPQAAAPVLVSDVPPVDAGSAISQPSQAQSETLEASISEEVAHAAVDHIVGQQAEDIEEQHQEAVQPRAKAVEPSKPQQDIPFATKGEDMYHGLYTALYEAGYHGKTNSSHCGDLVKVLLQKYKFRTILDVGCSNGYSVELLTKGGKDAKGVDVSDVAVKVARSMGRDVRYGSATNVPFPTDSFDVVMSTDCFEHLLDEDVDKGVDEAIRLAKHYIGMRICVRKEYHRKKEWKPAMAKWEQRNLHATVLVRDEWFKKFEKRAKMAGYKQARVVEEIRDEPSYATFVLKLGERGDGADRIQDDEKDEQPDE